MTTANIGINPGLATLPYAAATKRTKEVDLSSALTGSPALTAVKRAVAIFYSTSAGDWRMRFNIVATISATTQTEQDITIANVVFKNTASYFQAIAATNTVGAMSSSAFTRPGEGRITINHSSSSSTTYGISGDVELNAEPTTYTTAANMEGVLAADVYIPAADASTTGLVNTGAQTFAGVKTFADTTAATEYNAASVNLSGGLGVAGKIMTNDAVIARGSVRSTISGSAGSPGNIGVFGGGGAAASIAAGSSVTFSTANGVSTGLLVIRDTTLGAGACVFISSNGGIATISDGDGILGSGKLTVTSNGTTVTINNGYGAPHNVFACHYGA